MYRLTGVIVAVHALAHLLPWRVPRDDRTVFGYWFEAVACAAPLTAGALTWAFVAPGGALMTAIAGGRLAAGFLVAPFVAAFLIRLSGVDLRALRTGDLAFLAGPLPAHRAVARLSTMTSAIFAEEVIFRAVPAGLTSSGPLAMAVGATAFVSGHHMVRGSADRWSWPILRYEVAAAGMFAVLIAMSGSVWPAVAAHGVANLPQAILDVQRARPDLTSEVASG